MNEPSLRLLAIDDEYLIALDVQHILDALQWCSVEIDTTRNLVARMDADGPYDVVLLDPYALEEELAEVMAAIERSGAAPVFSSVDPTGEEELHPGVPRVLKPFAARPLLRAIAKALEPVQPVKALDVAASVSPSGPNSASPERSSSS